ncbi:hypothetical protein C5167_047440 [Papaver somniferum]|uniref:DUF7725 domain-containing protein n=1 Tax=Papaver somniferum TaxID=3469 RepID=A0A4Y7LGN0_PAPSO|nr:hypothetical protein C5167_047440 [Papaver somniferum]
MEVVSGGISASRGGGSLPPVPSSSTSPRKEWRAVSEQHSSPIRNPNNNEEFERSKLGQQQQSDHERTFLYEVQQVTGQQQLDGDLCSMLMNDNNNAEQKLHNIIRQRQELLQMEVELRAQFIARSEIIAMQNSYNAQINDHANAASQLKEQLREREQTIREMELKMEEMEKELHAVKMDNETAWAKEGLLREQNKELASFRRREWDNSEAERGQNLQQIHDLKEHIQEKDRLFLDLEEQHRVAQETIIYKDEQLREAQTWISRVNQMDLITNQTLEAELRQRTEQFNQFWVGCQRQFAEMEGHHLQVIQQLQLELAEARKRSGVYADDLVRAASKTKEALAHTQNKGNQISVNGGSPRNGNTSAYLNGNVEDFQAVASTGNVSVKQDQVPGVHIVPSSLFGIGAYGLPGQVAALHPFVMQQQGAPPSVTSANTHIPQSHVGQLQSGPAISFHPQWENQQAVPESSQVSSQSQYQMPQTEQGSGARYEYELTADGLIRKMNHLEVNVNPNQEPDPVITSNEEAEVLQSNDINNLVPHQPQQNFQENSQLDAALRLDSRVQSGESKVLEESIETAPNHSLEVQEQTARQLSSANMSSGSSTHSMNSAEATECNASVVVSSEASFPAERVINMLPVRKIPEPKLLDERSLLVCIVRAIPAGSGGQIRISSTLPNRLGKMLAPLHWHDYKKVYGKLDDFVSGHPELFVVDGDFIHLREGAQEIISATAAVAKVAAAAAASAAYSSLLPSVAVTPIAQSNRLKKVPSIEPEHVKIGSAKPSLSASSAQIRPSNGVHGLENVKLLGKPKDPKELNGVHMAVGNGGMPILQTKGSSNGRNGSSFAGKQQGSIPGTALTSRR